jgi:serine/threonine-protein kinase RsbW
MRKNLAKSSFKSDITALPKIQDFVAKAISGYEINGEKRDKILLAVAEAASNGIAHGNNSDKNLPLDVKIEAENNRIFIIISDKGKGFNPKSIPDPTEDENILKESGRGIFIIEKLIDKLTFNFSPSGTETILEISL